ncbi:ABC transporter ATP-binding protein [Rarobacter incanus]|uniref:Putative ABC transport system ATP-binding protein n=1 Tax=Rarobacter incanus TaxID=153494 RepID=A0A542SQA3_9MICO|nr:ABC transporter ATP-binding protein [Rarobacter incanus]TQK76793.1 putative ABC transport system ATP-binding protein [Rarobacter incanus]
MAVSHQRPAHVAGSAGPAHAGGSAGPAPADSIATATGLRKVYGSGDTEVVALDNVDVSIQRGTFTAIMGPSGSGKSTLMHCMAGLDRPTAGTVVVDGETISSLNERQLTKLRRTRLGFVFQAFNLIPTLTAKENITLPVDLARGHVNQGWFERVVDAVGLRDHLGHRPAELSGGQQQRVACARALITQPSVVFADEPTGNLDSVSSREVLTFLRQSVDELGQSVVVVTHDPGTAAFADRVLFLADGAIVGDLPSPSVDSVIEALRTFSERSRARASAGGASGGASGGAGGASGAASAAARGAGDAR